MRDLRLVLTFEEDALQDVLRSLRLSRVAVRVQLGSAPEQDDTLRALRWEHLTPRQQEICGRIAAGATNQEIATELWLTPGTVANHVANILRRLDFQRRAQIAAWAASIGGVLPAPNVYLLEKKAG